jgi:vesicle coat complex subunit
LEEQEVDVDFVRKSVNCIGQVAIRLEAAAQKCVEALLELVQLKISYVVQEAVVVVKVHFRASLSLDCLSLSAFAATAVCL